LQKILGFSGGLVLSYYDIVKNFKGKIAAPGPAGPEPRRPGKRHGMLEFAGECKNSRNFAIMQWEN
jgi:hypothetical protein